MKNRALNTGEAKSQCIFFGPMTYQTVTAAIDKKRNCFASFELIEPRVTFSKCVLVVARPLLPKVVNRLSLAAIVKSHGCSEANLSDRLR